MPETRYDHGMSYRDRDKVNKGDAAAERPAKRRGKSSWRRRRIGTKILSGAGNLSSATKWDRDSEEKKTIMRHKSSVTQFNNESHRRKSLKNARGN